MILKNTLMLAILMLLVMIEGIDLFSSQYYQPNNY